MVWSDNMLGIRKHYVPIKNTTPQLSCPFDPLLVAFRRQRTTDDFSSVTKNCRGEMGQIRWVVMCLWTYSVKNDPSPVDLLVMLVSIQFNPQVTGLFIFLTIVVDLFFSAKC